MSSSNASDRSKSFHPFIMVESPRAPDDPTKRASSRRVEARHAMRHRSLTLAIVPSGSGRRAAIVRSSRGCSHK
jgi:hypothetical protein